ncbi:MAG: NYN domain-containing protein [Pseudomonadota bacterium]|nr:NYN domain-containing protein [Pseudomonadota bacterium]
MNNTQTQQARLAVLIDADNAQPSLIERLLAEIAKYGLASVKRIYGDWTLPNLRGWKDGLAVHAIQPIQQFRYTVGKNATDSAMIIDAMDLLYTDRFDGFCLISSDSDFTRLASRIREAGLTVYGFGERKTPTAFVSACDKFIYVDVLSAPELDDDEDAPPKRKDSASLKRDARLVRLFRDALDANGDDEGWASLGAVGSHIANQAPDFDPRNYGYKKLGELAKALGVLEVDVQTVGATGQKAIRIRTKRRKSR